MSSTVGTSSSKAAQKAAAVDGQGEDAAASGKIVRFGVYPPIGIARVGNSKDEWFVGPEVPGLEEVLNTTNDEQLSSSLFQHKDSDGHVKKQAARFRVYGFDAKGQVVREITSGDEKYKVEWKVQVANRKASWYDFQGHHDGAYATPANNKLRNPSVQADKANPDERNDLVILSNWATVLSDKPDKRVSLSGKFKGEQKDAKEVHLGEIFTDKNGRLIVLGGSGEAIYMGPGDNKFPPLETEFDNKNWVDTTCDGHVEIKVIKKRNGKVVYDVTSGPEAKATVICTVPKFTPGIGPPTNLYDLIEDIAYKRLLRYDEKHKTKLAAKMLEVNYDEHVEPILVHVSNLAWVNKPATRGHGPGSHGHFVDKEWKALLSREPESLVSPTEADAKSKEARYLVLGRLRMPFEKGYEKERVGQASMYFMPYLSGSNDMQDGSPDTYSALTLLQFKRMEKWAQGEFKTVKPQPLKSISEVALNDQPMTLTKANLMWCIGLPLFPGIEVSWPCELEAMFYDTHAKVLTPEVSFRFNPKFNLPNTGTTPGLKPGDVTKYLSVPWQSDFYMCRNFWWPSARPDDVVPKERYDQLKKLLLDFDEVEQSHTKTAKGLISAKTKLKTDIAALQIKWERRLRANHVDKKSLETTYYANADMAKSWHTLGFMHTDAQLTEKLGYRVFFEDEETPDPSSPRVKDEFNPPSSFKALFKVFKDALSPAEKTKQILLLLQQALEVELSTIPLYLFAMYSVSNSKNQQGEAVDLIRTVVSEEMLHLALVGNIIKALGGTPRLYRKEDAKLEITQVPHMYPMKMEGHVPELVMNLDTFVNNLELFIQIEMPAEEGAEAEFTDDKKQVFFTSLGVFYKYIEDQLTPDDFKNSAKTTTYQFAPGMSFNPRVINGGGAVLVDSLESAKEALKIIVEQGEGYAGAKTALSRNELNHYNAFIKVKKIIDNDPNAVQCYDTFKNPMTKWYPEPIKSVSKAFDAAYCFLLVLIEHLWTVESENTLRRQLILGHLFGVMINVLPALSKFLLQQKIHRSDGVTIKSAAPTFNFYDFQGGNLVGFNFVKHAIGKVKAEIENAVSMYIDINMPEDYNLGTSNDEISALKIVQNVVTNLAAGLQ